MGVGPWRNPRLEAIHVWRFAWTGVSDYYFNTGGWGGGAIYPIRIFSMLHSSRVDVHVCVVCGVWCVAVEGSGGVCACVRLCGVC